MPPVTRKRKTEPKTHADLIAGMTQAEREALRLELTTTPTMEPLPDRELTPRERLIGSLLPIRNHLEGCPLEEASIAAKAVKTEAYDSVSPAPPSGLRQKGAVPGSTVTTVRCLQCGGSRQYLGSVRQVLADALSSVDEADDDESADL